jgi:TRAP-type mannitol/chloroaromatic compound transport system substrate-binding protein
MRRLGIVILFILMVFSLNNSVFAAEDIVYHWKMQSMDVASMVGPSITQKAFCERIKEMSGGRLEITLYTAGELTPTVEIVDSMERGMVDIAHTTGAYYTGTIPEAALETAGLPPLIFDSFRDAIQLYWYGGLDEIIREGYAKHGIYYLGSLIWDVPIAFWSKNPMQGVEDIKGYKARSFGYTAKALAKLGAAPVFLPHEEVYTAIAQGVIDGSMTDASYYARMKYDEVAPYLYLPGLAATQGNCTLISQKSWDALPNDLKEIVKEAFIHYTLDHGQRLWLEYDQMLRNLDEMGSTLIVWTDEDQRQIREAGYEFLPEIAEKSELNEKGIELIKNYLKEKGYLE